MFLIALAVLLMLNLAATAGAATAEEDLPVQVMPVWGTPAIAHALHGGEQDPGSTASRARPRFTSRRQAVFYATFPQLVTQPDGTRCIRIVRRAYPDATTAATVEDAQNVLWRISAQDYPLCSRTAAPGATPAAEAAAFWRVAGEDLLPRPAPRIAPGFMLAGKLAYLEANSVATAHFEHPTPLGLLVIDATSTLFVDWGDGTGVDGPHAGPGGPWPNGTITHSWSTAARYDVRVIQRWTATWRVGDTPASPLVGLSTEGAIEDFEVRQLQAVRNV